jgi:hypothetical protein
MALNLKPFTKNYKLNTQKEAVFMRQPLFLLSPVSIHEFLPQNCCISQQRDTPFVKNKVRCMALYTHLLPFL